MLTKEILRSYALIGAQARLAELDRERGDLLETFPELEQRPPSAVNRREIVTPDRRQILTPYSRCLKRQESFPVSMISQ